MRKLGADSILQSTKKPVEIVPCDDWLAKVRKAMEAELSGPKIALEADLESALRLNPAVKLLGFYEEMFRPAEEGPVSELELRETLARSEKLRRMPGLQASWVQRWVAQWLEP